MKGWRWRATWRLACERLVGFYGRRVRRILPPIYLYLGLIVPLVVVFHPELTSGWLASATFTYNFHYARDGVVPSPLLSHTWSLAVEEQFYLLFPFLLLYWRRRATAVLLVIWAVMITSSQLVRRDGHVRPDLVVRLLPVGAYRWVEVFNCLAAIVFAAALVWYGWQIVATSLMLDERAEGVSIT